MYTYTHIYKDIPKIELDGEWHQENMESACYKHSDIAPQ